MQRPIIAFQRDAHGDWTAALSCGHRQHVRHDPSFVRPWVTTEAGRVSRLGVPLDCLRCDRFEVSEDVVPTSHTPEFTERTIPGGLKANHATARSVWGPDHRDGRAAALPHRHARLDDGADLRGARRRGAGGAARRRANGPGAFPRRVPAGAARGFLSTTCPIATESQIARRQGSATSSGAATAGALTARTVRTFSSGAVRTAIPKAPARICLA